MSLNGRTLPALLLLVAAALAWAWLAGRRGRAEDRAAWARAVASADSAASAWRDSAVRADTVFRVDSIRVVRTETRRVVVRDSLLRTLTDTLLVREYVRVTDSAAAACSVALASCGARVSARDSIIAALRTSVALLRSPPPARRLEPFAELLYAAPHGPVARAGAQWRVLGPIALVGVAEGWRDGALRGRVGVGVRVAF